MYRDGDSVAKDAVKAFELYQIAVDWGEMKEALNLGRMYKDGDGVAEDAVKAIFQPALDAGEMAAALNLGVMYINGDGVARDAIKARTLFLRALDGGIINAMKLYVSLTRA